MCAYVGVYEVGCGFTREWLERCVVYGMKEVDARHLCVCVGGGVCEANLYTVYTTCTL